MSREDKEVELKGESAAYNKAMQLLANANQEAQNIILAIDKPEGDTEHGDFECVVAASPMFMAELAVALFKRLPPDLRMRVVIAALEA